MARRSSGRQSRRRGERIGPWMLLDPLGAGGNGEVWRAADSDGRDVALKLLHPKYQTPGDARYKRFRDEMQLHDSLRGRPGILPVVSSHLPERPTRQDPAWLATELATGIRAALGREANLEAVVQAVGEIASALAALHAAGISHRDVKPSNLYRHGDAWVVGDFGLVDFPDKESVTETGERLGPAHFIAPEMLADAKAADGSAADVYSLAKTLWVLVTGQNFPPPGELRIDVRQLTMGGYVAHRRIHLLDVLVERATRHGPAARPNMADMAAELASWQAPPSQPTGPPDLSSLAARIAAVSGPALRAEERRLWRVKQGPRAFQGLKEHLEVLGHAAAQAIPGSSLGFMMEGITQNLILGGPLVRMGGDWLGEHAFIVKGPGSNPVTLRGGVCVAIPPNDRMLIFAGYLIGTEAFYDKPRAVWADSWSAPIGSAEQERILSQTMTGLSDNLRHALESYAREVEARWPSQPPPQPAGNGERQDN